MPQCHGHARRNLPHRPLRLYRRLMAWRPTNPTLVYVGMATFVASTGALASARSPGPLNSVLTAVAVLGLAMVVSGFLVPPYANWERRRDEASQALPDFMPPLRAAYDKWRDSQAGGPRCDLDELLQRVGWPPGVPLGDDTHLREWARRTKDSLSPDQLAMWTFVNAVYRDAMPSDLVADARSFHAARWTLKKFCDWCGDNGDLGFSGFLRKHVAYYRLPITALAWLELALATTPAASGATRGPGASGLWVLNARLRVGG